MEENKEKLQQQEQPEAQETKSEASDSSPEVKPETPIKTQEVKPEQEKVEEKKPEQEKVEEKKVEKEKVEEKKPEQPSTPIVVSNMTATDSSERNDLPKEVTTPPKLYKHSSASITRVEQANQAYIESATRAYDRYKKGQITKQKYKELIKIYKRDFDFTTKGRLYRKFVKLHTKGKILKSAKLFDFGCFVLWKERAQRVSALAHENAILYRKARATKDNAIYMADEIEIDKYKNVIFDIKTQLKYDVEQYKLEEDSEEKIIKAQQEAQEKIKVAQYEIMRQKKRNQEFYKDIRQRRERLQIDARQEYDEARKVYLLQLKDAKEEVVSTHEAKVAKKQKIKNIKHKLKSAKYSYQHNMFMAKNYHPAWSTDPDIKSMFTQVHSMKMNKLELEKQFDDRIDTLKESFRSRIDGIQSVPQAKKDRIINWTFFTTWYNHAGFKILSMIAMCLIVFFSILGLFDSIPETSFLLHHAYVGSISVFIFVALIILAIWIGFKVASLVRRRAGVYDIVEAKYSKEESVSNTIGLTSKPSDEFNYLEELFTKEEKEETEERLSSLETNRVTMQEKVEDALIKQYSTSQQNTKTKKTRE